MAFKIGFLINGSVVDKNNYEIIKWLSQEKNVELKCLLASDKLANNKYLFIKFGFAIRFVQNLVISEILMKTVFAFEKLLLTKTERIWLKNFDVVSYFDEVYRINASKSFSESCCDDAVIAINKIKNMKLDLIIRVGSNNINSGVVELSKHGILSFSHGNNRIKRGGAPGFWEIINKCPETGFTIERLIAGKDYRDILYSGSFCTKRTWVKNYINVQIKANHYMKNVINQFIKKGVFLSVQKSYPYSMPLYKKPSAIIILLYLVNVVLHYSGRIFDRYLLNVDFIWHIAYQECKWSNLEMFNSKVIYPPKGTFLADPFAINYLGCDYILAEEESYKNKRGHIVAYVIKDGEALRLGKVLCENFHLSYPYMFKYRDTIYMVPEASETRSVRLYSSITFPMEWKFEKVLLEDISAVDATIFEKNGIWWMFVNIEPSEQNDHSSELFAFSALDPINGTWVPHDLNPLIINPQNGRMGGILFEADKIYRVSQSQGFMVYGQRSIIHEIKELTQNSFREEALAVNYPLFLPGLIGTHHMHSTSTLTVFDFCKKKRIY